MKKGECYFWPPEPKLFGFFGFSKTDLVGHDERNRMAFTPLKSALRFSRSHGGPNRPPHQLTRALLGLVRTLPAAGGGGVAAPHLSRKPTDVGEKLKRQWTGLDEIFQIQFKNLTSRSSVTSQVRSNTKCLTFPFNAFPRQNAGNKRISSR